MTSCPPPEPVSPRRRASFRQRYDDLELRREALIGRLERLGDKARSSPSSIRALKLLNSTFRKSRLVQRAAVLQAAQWLIDLAELWSTVA